MLIMAIDPNSKTGITEGEPGESPHLQLVRFRRDETDTPDDVFERVTFHFAQRLRADPPDHVFIEAPVPPSSVSGFTNFNTSLITLGVYAIITGIVKCKGIPIHRAPINSWRKVVLGNGRMKGDAAKRAAMQLCRRLGWQPQDDNVAESACIWLYGCSQVAPASVTTSRPALFAERA